MHSAYNTLIAYEYRGYGAMRRENKLHYHIIKIIRVKYLRHFNYKCKRKLTVLYH